MSIYLVCLILLVVYLIDKPKIAEEFLEINTIEKVLRPAFEVDTKLPLLQQRYFLFRYFSI